MHINEVLDGPRLEDWSESLRKIGQHSTTSLPSDASRAMFINDKFMTRKKISISTKCKETVKNSSDLLSSCHITPLPHYWNPKQMRTSLGHEHRFPKHSSPTEVDPSLQDPNEDRTEDFLYEKQWPSRRLLSQIKQFYLSEVDIGSPNVCQSRNHPH